MIWAGASFYSNFVDSFSKAESNWIRSVENIMGSWGKNISKKKLQGQKEKELFRNTKKFS